MELERQENKINTFLLHYFNYLILALGLIILAAGLFILVYPKYQRIAKANQEAKNNLQTEYEDKLNYLNSISNLKKSYRSISEGDRAKLAGLVPPESDTNSLITEIESMAARNGVILTSIKIESKNAVGRNNFRVESKENQELAAGIFSQPPPAIGLIKMEVSLSSVDYSALKNIIKTFENNLRLLDLADISFNVSENQALLIIYSYYWQ
ncbi:MAG: type 4a pilus biogenesis protein PilO [Parcubacteria group bacterium]|nr:type 4a pilus biogenesis protein PilO [Parcubacteria group bacterium]